MDIPSPWGAAAGCTAEALKTHRSGVLPAAAGQGGAKQKRVIRTFFYFTTGNIYFKLRKQSRKWGEGEAKK